MKYAALVLVCLVSCANEVQPDTRGLTEEVHTYNLVERPGGTCGRILSFTSRATALCERVEYLSGTEVGCVEGFVKWITLLPDRRTGSMQVTTDTCESVYDISW